MLIPVIVGLGLVSLFKGPPKRPTNYGLMTAERQHLYDSALNSRNLTSEQYDHLAQSFDENGLQAQALLLRKRARLRAMPESAKAERKAIIRKLLKDCQDPDTIEKFAAICEGQGASGSAKTLRIHAIGVRNALKVKPVTVAPAPAPTSASSDGESTEAAIPSKVEQAIAAVDSDDEDLNEAGERISDRSGIDQSQFAIGEMMAAKRRKRKTRSRGKFERYYLRNTKTGQLLRDPSDGHKIYFSSKSIASANAKGTDYKVDAMIRKIGQ